MSTENLVVKSVVVKKRVGRRRSGNSWVIYIGTELADLLGDQQYKLVADKQNNGDITMRLFPKTGGALHAPRNPIAWGGPAQPAFWTSASTISKITSNPTCAAFPTITAGYISAWLI